MTRLSHYFLPTEKEAPADAEALSHRLMVRAGLIRQVGSGLWSWLPAGWRVHQRISAIVREEIDAIGGQEMLMPVIQPAELWKRSGRYAIEELFKLEDRRGAELVLAMTHEEVVTSHVAQVIRSYRDLPLILYHMQVKGRDEPRPRAGVLRTREFVMKDSYSFDRDQEGLQRSYERHIEAYDRIFERTGLRWYRVAGDVGVMGGTGAHEYMAPCAGGGERGRARARLRGQRRGRQRRRRRPSSCPQRLTRHRRSTRRGDDDRGRRRQLGLPAGALLKAFPVEVEGRGLVMVDGARRSPRQRDQARRRAGRAVACRDRRGDRRADRPARVHRAGRRPAAGAARRGRRRGQLRGRRQSRGHAPAGRASPGRDFAYERVDVRTVEAGDLVGGQPITIEPAIEVANIFQLGTRYAQAFGATYLDEQGAEQLIWMGSYGIGMARIAAAAVEQFADEHGISWPAAIAPFQVHLVALGKPASAERTLADAVYAALRDGGVEVLYDDREAGPGRSSQTPSCSARRCG